VIVNLQPCGEYLMADFDAAGGLPVVFGFLRDRIHGDCPTANGLTWAQNLQHPTYENLVILSPTLPLFSAGSLATLRGSLAPRGALLRVATATRALCQHRGQAVVFENYSDLLRRIDAEDLPVAADSVLVLRNAGAVGVPGLPEWGNIPIPAKLLRTGVKDMVRISDSRMSGTAYGTVVLHVTPEAALGGPLALVRNGDWIELDLVNRRLDLLVSEGELAQRQREFQAPSSAHRRGYPFLYQSQVLQPDEGCDFAFLQPQTEEAMNFIPPQVGRS
jgi:dihydroxy-acid dehydratase